MNRTCGFTLMEVLAAFAVLASGLAAISFFPAAFARMSAREESRADAVVEAISYLERRISAPERCSDTLFACPAPACGGGFSVLQSWTPGMGGFQWVEVRAEPYVFRRLLRCTVDLR